MHVQLYAQGFLLNISICMYACCTQTSVCRTRLPSTSFAPTVRLAQHSNLTLHHLHFRLCFIVLCIQQHAPQRSSHTSPCARPDGPGISVTKNARTSCWLDNTTPETRCRNPLARFQSVRTPKMVSTTLEKD